MTNFLLVKINFKVKIKFIKVQENNYKILVNKIKMDNSSKMVINKNLEINKIHFKNKINKDNLQINLIKIF
jgi:hypothetical protein